MSLWIIQTTTNWFSNVNVENEKRVKYRQLFWAAKVDSYYMKLFASKSNLLPNAESWFYVIFDIAHDTALDTEMCKIKAKSVSVLTADLPKWIRT